MITGKIKKELERIWIQMTNYFPYIIIWHWKKWRKSTDGIIVFLQSPIHYVMFENIHAYLPNVRIVAGNRKTSDFLQSRGILHSKSRLYPDVVILADYDQNRYPIRAIKKIQIYHGVGIKNYFYNKADKEIYYLVPGHYAANKLKDQGKERVYVVGYPKTDGFFSNSWRKEEMCCKFGVNPEKKTILYTPTWGKASTAPILHEYVGKLGERYNVFVKLHDHSPDQWRNMYRNIPNVIYCEDVNPTPYQFVADLLISDFSSTIFEYAQLKRPVISCGISEEMLRNGATDPRWWDISCRVSNPYELEVKVTEMLTNDWRPSEYYLRLITEIFRYSDGGSAQRAASVINDIASYSNTEAG